MGSPKISDDKFKKYVLTLDEMFYDIRNSEEYINPELFGLLESACVKICEAIQDLEEVIYTIEHR